MGGRCPASKTCIHVFFLKPPKVVTLGNQEVRTNREKETEKGIQVSKWPTDQSGLAPYYSHKGNSIMFLYQEINKGRKLGSSVLKGAYLHVNVVRLCSEGVHKTKMTSTLNIIFFSHNHWSSICLVSTTLNLIIKSTFDIQSPSTSVLEF